MAKGMRIMVNWQHRRAGRLGPVASQLSSSHLRLTTPMRKTWIAHCQAVSGATRHRDDHRKAERLDDRADEEDG
eukprot:90640-Hanusia_phi.AAC.2